MISGRTELFGIIGNPVRHSLSPAMHNAAFRELGLDCVYVPLATDDIAAGVAGIKALGFSGASVTVPYKQDVIALVDELDPTAARIGAVNTLVIREDGPDSGGRTICGYNTDWLGANRALAGKIDLAGTRVLVLGAGGSARAIGLGLLKAGAEIVLANRTLAKGQALAHELGCPCHGLDELGQVSADVLVNTTSVGMEPDSGATPIRGDLLARFKVVMDIVYAPLETRLLREAAEAGCQTVNGLAMLLYQGAAQFKLWTGREAPVNVMRQALSSRFQQSER